MFLDNYIFSVFQQNTSKYIHTNFYEHECIAVEQKNYPSFNFCPFSGEGLHVSYIVGGFLSVLIILLLIGAVMIYR